MGWWQDRQEAAERERQKKEEEARQRQQRADRYKKEREENWGDLKQGFGAALQKAGEHIGARLKDFMAAEERQKQLVSDPQALDAFSDVELEHLRITTENEVEKYNEMYARHEHDNSYLFNEDYVQHRRLLLRLIEANQRRRDKPQPEEPKAPPSAAQRRKELLAQIQDLMDEKAETKARMTARQASENQIRDYENMFDDAIQKKQAQLRKILDL